MELTNREDAPPDSVQSPQSAQPQVTQVTITPPADDPMAGLTDASNGKGLALVCGIMISVGKECIIEYIAPGC